MKKHKKICFAIMEIAESNTPARNRSDTVLTYVMEPAVRACGFKLLRGDQITGSDLIVIDKIKRHLFNDEMVIVDLTGLNSNVVYEVGFRHAIGKPVVQIAALGQKLPFDLAPTRTIFYDLTDPKSVAIAIKEIAKQIRDIQESDVKSHVATNGFQPSLGLQSEGDDQVLSKLKEIHQVVRKIESHPLWRVVDFRVSDTREPKTRRVKSS